MDTGIDRDVYYSYINKKRELQREKERLIEIERD